jgi:protoheme IX farnesyltransferase
MHTKAMTSLSVFCRCFPEQSLLCYGCRHRRFGIEAGTLFLIQFFWFYIFWAIGWFFCMTIMRGWFLCLPTGKRQKAQRYRLFLHHVWLILASLLPVFSLHQAFVYYAGSGSKML